MTALLPAQSICKRFRAIIKSSLPIQKALFFAGTPDFDPSRHPEENPYVDNPLLHARFRGWARANSTDPGYNIVVFRSLFCVSQPDWESLMQPTASWHNMFITQPPCKFCNMSLAPAGEVCVWAAEGITMGFLIEAVERALTGNMLIPEEFLM